MQGGAHALASVVRVRLPSASSEPLHRAQSAAPPINILHSTRRCAPDTLQSNWTAARARTALRKRAS
eukprot:2854065-Prymnesium_polylepis.1